MDASGSGNGRDPDALAGADSVEQLGETRPLSVLFVDLVGSARLATGYSREENRRIILSYRKAVRSVVEKYDGTIARAFGDGLLIGFGEPKVHEDDPERSIRAAHDIHDSLRILSAQEGRNCESGKQGSRPSVNVSCS